MRLWLLIAQTWSVLALEAGTIDTLVQRRCKLRAHRLFIEADAIKADMEAAGIHLQDEAGGGTTWHLEDRRAFVPAASGVAAVLSLAKRAESHADERSVVDQCCREVLLDDERAIRALLGRKAADAAFSFAIAGAYDERLFDSLARQQAAEFARWRRPQPLATLQVCERLAAAGVLPSHAVFATAAATLAAGDAPTAAQSVRSLRFGSTRSLLWLWRRAKTMRKCDAPSPASSRHSLSAARFDEPQLPLVLDLGCGFGTTLLSMLDLDLPELRPELQPEYSDRTRVNVLGCDASSTKCAYASGIAARWGHSSRASFAHASAEETLAWAAKEHPGSVRAVLLQFPTPYSVLDPSDEQSAGQSSGNAQLPKQGGSFMVNEELIRSIAAVLRAPDPDGGAGHEARLSPALSGSVEGSVAQSDGWHDGWLLVQSNVEDVALYARELAERCGMRAFGPLTATDPRIETAADSTAGPESVAMVVASAAVQTATVVDVSPAERANRRRERLELQRGEPLPRAAGAGWVAESPLGHGLRTETEAALEFSGKRVFRCLLRPDRRLAQEDAP